MEHGPFKDDLPIIKKKKIQSCVELPEGKPFMVTSSAAAKIFDEAFTAINM
jgi:hypothetical protein